MLLSDKKTIWLQANFEDRTIVTRVANTADMLQLIAVWRL